MIQCFFRCTVALWTLEDLLWEKDAQRARAAKKIQAFIRNRKYRAKLLLWDELARLEARAKAEADEQARTIQHELAEADALLALAIGRASDEEARNAESLVVIEAAAEETKDNEGKYAYHVCSVSLYYVILTSSSFVSFRTEEEDVHELARLQANASAVELRARAESELVLRLDDAAEEAKENEGEYISFMCTKVPSPC